MNKDIYMKQYRKYKRDYINYIQQIILKILRDSKALSTLLNTNLITQEDIQYLKTHKETARALKKTDGILIVHTPVKLIF